MNNFKELIILIFLCLMLQACNLLNDSKSESYPFELKISNHEYPLNLKLDKPWEERGIGYINVIKTDSLWHLWYESFGENSLSYGRVDYNSYLSYAYSTDGTNWVKPNLSYNPYGEHKETNILISNNGISNNGIHGMTVFVDSNAGRSEEGAYKMVYARWIDSLSSNWIYGMTSKDGLVWDNERIIKRHYSDTQTVAYFHNGLYKLFYRYWNGGSHGQGYRQIGFSEGKNFDETLGEQSIGIKFNNLNVSQKHLYNNATRVIGNKYEFMFPSFYYPAQDKMELKIAYRKLIDNQNHVFTFYNYDKNIFKELPSFKALYVAPQAIKISENNYMIYYSYKNESHSSSFDSSKSYVGKVGRFRLQIISK